MIEAQYVLLGIAMAAAVGPVCIETVRRGLKHGFYYAFPVILGASLGDAIYLLLVYYGLSDFLKDPAIARIMWILGTSVLFTMAYKCFKGFISGTQFKGQIKKRNSFLAGFVISISSPITIIWWLGIFGTLVSRLPKEAALANGLVIILGSITWFFFISILLHWGKRWVNEKSIRYVSLLAGIGLSCFGLYFAYNAINLLI
jgi:threonine/homoserine/homoserine lactone efflux protein